MQALEAQLKAITLRNLPPELAAKIEHEAARNNASLNATVIRLLRQSVGGGAVEKAQHCIAVVPKNAVAQFDATQCAIRPDARQRRFDQRKLVAGSGITGHGDEAVDGPRWVLVATRPLYLVR